MKHIIIHIILIIGVVKLYSQNPLRYRYEVNQILENDKPVINDESLVLFTGSSSIKYWKDVQNYFPDYVVLNHGFGGSHMSDLLFYLDDLIFKFDPKVIIIYEGDNDLYDGEKPSRIIEEVKIIRSYINEIKPESNVAFISAKPSPARYNLHRQYRKFNRKLKRFCNKTIKTTFIDVWHPMFRSPRKLNSTLFVNDGVHLNEAGYKIWAIEISNYLYRIKQKK